MFAQAVQLVMREINEGWDEFILLILSCLLMLES